MTRKLKIITLSINVVRGTIYIWINKLYIDDIWTGIYHSIKIYWLSSVSWLGESQNEAIYAIIMQ